MEVDVPQELLAPYHHLCQQQGKNIRAKLIAAFNLWIGLSPSSEERVNQIVAMLHNASLLIDDIEDGATLRRGQPVAHSVFGTALTLNCGNHMYFAALAKVMELVEAPTNQRPVKPEVKMVAQAELVAAYTTELQQLHIGQGLDVLWRDTFSVPSLEQYESMVLQKTGGLFRLALKLMLALRKYEVSVASPPPPDSGEQQVSGSPSSNLFLSSAEGETEKVTQKLLELVNTFSLLFQILDDYMNLRSEAYHTNKSFCEDLSEGKFSYLVTHSILTARGKEKTDSRLFHALRQRPQTEEMKRFCLRLMEETGTIEHTKAKLLELKAQLEGQIASLGGNPLLQQCLDGLFAKDCNLC